MMQHILTPVLRHFFTVVRADKISRTGSITHQIFKLLAESDLVVADITGLNPNVMYEIGIRHAINKAMILMADHKTTIPFDIGQERAIIFDVGDLISANSAKDDLRKMVRELQGDEDLYVSPFFVATHHVPGSGPAHSEEIVEKLEYIQNSMDEVSSIVEMNSYSDVSNVAHEVSEIAWELKLLKYEIQDLKKRT